MAEYAQLSGGSVWYDERGEGEPLVMIHGGAVDSRFFDHNVDALAERLRVIRTDLWGHGRTADREGPFSYASFVADVAELIELVADGPAHVFGHSIGAGVAMVLAMRRPELVRNLVLASGGFNIEADAPVDIDSAVEQSVAFLGSTYGEVSPDGQDHFAAVVRKDFELSAREPKFTAEDIAVIGARTLVLTADDDLTPLDHTLEMYRAIPNSELAVVPGTSHFFLQEKPEASNAILLDFLTRDPVPTVAPIRRAPAAEVAPA
jgi:pimeloyl-ACP methyl ester carboxylesterase